MNQIEVNKEISKLILLFFKLSKNKKDYVWSYLKFLQNNYKISIFSPVYYKKYQVITLDFYYLTKKEIEINHFYTCKIFFNSQKQLIFNNGQVYYSECEGYIHSLSKRIKYKEYINNKLNNILNNDKSFENFLKQSILKVL